MLKVQSNVIVRVEYLRGNRLKSYKKKRAEKEKHLKNRKENRGCLMRKQYEKHG